MPVKSRPDGTIDLEDLAAKVDGQTVALMITNPNTLGLFEKNIHKAAKIVHDGGATLYLDGANMNAILGIAGRAISAPTSCTSTCTRRSPPRTAAAVRGPARWRWRRIGLPAAAAGGRRVEKERAAYCARFRPAAVRGQMRSFAGQFGVFVRAWCYIRSLRAGGLQRPQRDGGAERQLPGLGGYASTVAACRLRRACLHEFVLSGDQRHGTSRRGLAGKIGKRLLDYGMHAPTVYFPLIVPEALMIEPTETETKETLDRFAEVVAEILEEAREDPEVARSAPAHNAGAPARRGRRGTASGRQAGDVARWSE